MSNSNNGNTNGIDPFEVRKLYQHVRVVDVADALQDHEPGERRDLLALSDASPGLDVLREDIALEPDELLQGPAPVPQQPDALLHHAVELRIPG